MDVPNVHESLRLMLSSEMYGLFEPSENVCGSQNHDRNLNESIIIQQQLILLYFSRIRPTSPSQQLYCKQGSEEVADCELDAARTLAIAEDG